MKASKSSKSMIERAKKTLLGRMVCRLAGDEKGAVMMEYVIVAVLIAAACVVAVAFFGKTIMQQFSAAARATAGESADAVAQRDEAEKSSASAKTDGATHADAFNDVTGQ